MDDEQENYDLTKQELKAIECEHSARCTKYVTGLIFACVMVVSICISACDIFKVYSQTTGLCTLSHSGTR